MLYPFCSDVKEKNNRHITKFLLDHPVYNPYFFFSGQKK